MHKYRKKPVIIEAFQMTKKRRQDNSDWPEWLHCAWNKDISELNAVSCEDWPYSDGTDRLIINTMKGIMHVDWNDYIIRDIKKELYSCKPDIFEATYEEVNDASKSKLQQRAASIANAAKSGKMSLSKLKGAAKETAKMDKEDLEEFAKTKRKGLPKKRVKNEGKRFNIGITKV